ncbi:hypothetical protein Salat_2613900 [Sesamum alatum]|uniref:Uncharacterized protein n=1 Tax=Sesamum alatum TaxID=300844 RepID=A0AAE2CAJ1_9LAMI|nr:hypothetical protein Salat_2613900 [Sesamum alatum]
MWIRHLDLLEVVKRSWSFPTVGVGMAKLSEKLRRLKHRLKDWNRLTFGDIFHNLQLAEPATLEAERLYDRMPTDFNLMHMNRCTTQLTHVLTIEEDFWRQKAACKWVLDGDRNTRFYHSMVQKKRARNFLSALTVNGQEITAEDLPGSGVAHFRQLLTSDNHQPTAPQTSIVPRFGASHMSSSCW